MPLAVLFGPEAVEFRLRDSGAKVVVTDVAHRDMLQELGKSAAHAVLSPAAIRALDVTWPNPVSAADVEVITADIRDYGALRAACTIVAGSV